uniref:DCUN1 domain-containing protein n=1 Tax=Globodera pallida TaxID=36090 RepID=A0A183CMN7_GLOPA
MFLDFLEKIDSDLGNYDADDSWPVLIDEFVLASIDANIPINGSRLTVLHNCNNNGRMTDQQQSPNPPFIRDQQHQHDSD